MIDLAGGDHLLHQRQGFRGDAEISEAGGEAGEAEDAYRIFGKGGADMPQDFGRNIALTVEGVDQRAVVSSGDGVDGQIAAGEVVFKCDVGCRMESEAVVAVAGLALGTRQGVLLVRLRVQEDREIPPDRPEAAGKHFFGRGTDDHVIAVVAGAAEQFIADSAANDENLHSRPGQRLSGRRDSGSCRACPWGC